MTTHLENTVFEPLNYPPRALAFVAHGRLGGHMGCPRTSAIAEHLRTHHGARVVKWNARGVGASEGQNEYSSWDAWVGRYNCEDYKEIVRDELSQFVSEFPQAGNERKNLFICGYSTGAIHATTIRLPQEYDRYFYPVKYILLSYPILASPFLGIEKTGWYFNALEGLVGGTWEGCTHERQADVLILNGALEVPWYSPAGWAYLTWRNILFSKRRGQGKLNAVCVDGANHVWEGKLDQIGIEIDRWLAL